MYMYTHADCMSRKTSIDTTIVIVHLPSSLCSISSQAYKVCVKNQPNEEHALQLKRTGIGILIWHVLDIEFEFEIARLGLYVDVNISRTFCNFPFIFFVISSDIVCIKPA
jgi:hypothetical protein